MAPERSSREFTLPASVGIDELRINGQRSFDTAGIPVSELGLSPDIRRASRVRRAHAVAGFCRIERTDDAC